MHQSLGWLLKEDCYDAVCHLFAGTSPLKVVPILELLCVLLNLYPVLFQDKVSLWGDDVLNFPICLEPCCILCHDSWFIIPLDLLTRTVHDLSLFWQHLKGIFNYFYCSSSASILPMAMLALPIQLGRLGIPLYICSR